jgi:hypothetical protein
VPDELFALAGARVEDDAGAGAEDDLTPGDADRRRKAFEQSLGKGDGLVLDDLFEQECELVAAESGNRVAHPDDVVEALCHLSQELIACVVTERVVYLFEAVQIDENDGQRTVGAFGTGERLIEAVAEESAVGEAGEIVVECLMRQLRLELDPLGDVSCVEHDSAYCLVPPEVSHVRFEVSPFAGLVQQLEDDLARAAVSRCSPQGFSIL